MNPSDGGTQREQLLFDIVHILARTILDRGADGQILHSRLFAVRHTAFAAGKTEAVEILDRLIEDLFPAPKTPPKSPFRIV